MRRINLSNPPFKHNPADPPGFKTGMARLGLDLGAQETGTTVFELPAGEAVCPYHYELGEEEWLLVLEGRPTLRTPEGNEQLEPLDLAFFPKGPAGAHQVRNDSDQTARVMMWSTVVHPTATVYPDSGKVGVWTGGDKVDDGMFVQSTKVDYWHGETGGQAG